MDKQAFPFELDATLLSQLQATLPEGESVAECLEGLLARVVATGGNVESAVEKERVARAVREAFRREG